MGQGRGQGWGLKPKAPLFIKFVTRVSFNFKKSVLTIASVQYDKPPLLLSRIESQDNSYCSYSFEASCDLPTINR